MRVESTSNAKRCVFLKRAACFMCGIGKLFQRPLAAPMQPESTAKLLKTWSFLVFQELSLTKSKAEYVTYLQIPRFTCRERGSIEKKPRGLTVVCLFFCVAGDVCMCVFNAIYLFVYLFFPPYFSVVALCLFKLSRFKTHVHEKQPNWVTHNKYH